MPYLRRRTTPPEEFVSPKQREALAVKKAELLGEIDKRLNEMPDSYVKEELVQKRNHCESKFPVFPVDLNGWIVAYHEDWMRDYDRAMAETHG